MKLFEVTINRPVPIIGAPQLIDILSRMGTYDLREWKIGQPLEDITDTRWSRPSHAWLMSRTSSGIGVLEIKPVFRRASIDYIERRRGQHEKKAELKGVVHSLNRPGIIQLLGGGVAIGRERRSMYIYKMICTTKDEVKDPFG